MTQYDATSSPNMMPELFHLYFCLASQLQLLSLCSQNCLCITGMQHRLTQMPRQCVANIWCRDVEIHGRLAMDRHSAMCTHCIASFLLWNPAMTVHWKSVPRCRNWHLSAWQSIPFRQGTSHHFRFSRCFVSWCSTTFQK